MEIPKVKRKSVETAALTTNDIKSHYVVVIIGGGLGGLAAAVALQRVGINCTIYERDHHLTDRKQGYGLTLTNNSKGSLSKLGLLDKCIESDCPSICHWLFRPNGTILGYYGRSFKPNYVSKTSIECGTRGNLRIPREDLRKMLLDSLKPGVVKWGKVMKKLSESYDHVTVEFEDGEIVTADVLVGADGIKSKVRKFREEILSTKQKKPSIANSNNIEENLIFDAKSNSLHDLGVSVIIGISTAVHPLLDKQGFYVLDGSHRLFTMPFREGILNTTPDNNNNNKNKDNSSSHNYPENYGLKITSCENKTNDMFTDNMFPSNNLNREYSSPPQTMWQLSFAEASNEQLGKHLRKSSDEIILQEALRRTQGWFPPVPDLITQTIPGEVWATRLVDMDPIVGMGRDKESRIVLIGDACHPMSMFKGQGANQALEDGPLLASWLDPKRDTRNAITTTTYNNHNKKSKNSCNDNLHNTHQESIITEYPIDNNSSELDSNNSKQQNITLIEESNRIIKEKKRKTLLTKLRCFEREMLSRTKPKVLASREAARHYHSAEALEVDYGIEGCMADNNAKILQLFEEKNITAFLGETLEDRARDVLVSNSIIS